MNIDGKCARTLFNLRSDFVHLNCGSHGACPREVTEKRNSLIDEMDKETDLWFRDKFHQHFHAAANLVADTYNAERAQITLVENATTGIHCILRSLNLGPNDTIIVTSFTYGAIRMQCEDVAQQNGATLHSFDIKFPFTHESIISQYESELKRINNEGRRIAIIDHITSFGSLLMPVDEIVKLCKEMNTLSLVDGAHAPGQLTPERINLRGLDPDFYVANLHKWAFVPRTCAFLFVSKRFLDIIRPQVVSFLHHKSFRQRFAVRGTFDGTVIATIPAAFQFSEKCGGVQGIQSYVTPLLRTGVQIVADRLGGGLICDPEYSAPFMISLYLGQKFDEKMSLLKPITQQMFGKTLHKLLREDYKIVCPTISVINNRVAMRISGFIFTELEDFHKLADGLEALEFKLRSISKEDVESWLHEDDPMNDKVYLELSPNEFR